MTSFADCPELTALQVKLDSPEIRRQRALEALKNRIAIKERILSNLDPKSILHRRVKSELEHMHYELNRRTR